MPNKIKTILRSKVKHERNFKDRVENIRNDIKIHISMIALKILMKGFAVI